MKMDSEMKIVVVFRGTTWQAGMVKNLLENEEIEAYLNGENRGTFNPGWTYTGEEGSVRVVVSSLDYQKAKKVVDDYMENLKST